MTDLQLPQSFDAEQKLLACFLRDSSSYAKVGAMIDVESFSPGKHREIYRAILELCRKQQPTDITTVNNQLEKQGSPPDRVYLVELAGMVAGATGILGYAEIVREKSKYRRLINLCHQIERSAYMQEQSPDELIGVLNRESVAIVKKSDFSGFKKLSEFTNQTIDQLDSFLAGEKKGITTGFKSLDELIAGFQPRDLVYIGAESSEGKTALTYCMAAEEAKAGLNVGYFSAETGGREFGLRALCTISQVNSRDLRRGSINEKEVDSLTMQNNKIHGWGFWLCETPCIDIDMLIVLASQLHKEVGLDIIYVDYLQLLTTTKRFKDKRLETNDISRKFKYLAQTLNLPVVVCSQLSRDITKRKNKEPQKSDLRESGNLENDADIIIMPQRYATVAPRKEDRRSNIATLYVRKARNAATGQIDLLFEKEYTLFSEFETWELPFDPS